MYVVNCTATRPKLKRSAAQSLVQAKHHQRETTPEACLYLLGENLKLEMYEKALPSEKNDFTHFTPI
jgi:hypothetical protein